MVSVLVRTEIDASPADVWAVVRDIAHHVDWMEDAVGIRFTSERTSGVGTRFDCETRFGPIELTDRMEVTEWEEGRLIGVRHTGLVTGEGDFRLVETPDGRTVFSWDETLRFPWWLGGPLGEVPAAWVLRRVWRRNLANLAAEVRARSSSRRRR
jgi:hypothetical protein